MDGGSSQTLRNVCESQTGRTESECRNINVSLTGGAYGQCAFTIDKCKDNPCTLLGDEGATCSNATDSGGNLKAMCTCSSGFVQSSYQGSDRPICEKTFCDRASTVATSIMENSFFFDCTSYIPAATYTPDDVFTTTRFSYYLGCGVRSLYIHSLMDITFNSNTHECLFYHTRTHTNTHRYSKAIQTTTSQNTTSQDVASGGKRARIVRNANRFQFRVIPI